MCFLGCFLFKFYSVRLFCRSGSPLKIHLFGVLVGGGFPLMSGSLLLGGFLLGVCGSCGALPSVGLSCSGVVCCCSCFTASVYPFGVYGCGAFACVDDAFGQNGLLLLCCVCCPAVLVHADTIGSSFALNGQKCGFASDIGW